MSSAQDVETARHAMIRKRHDLGAPALRYPKSADTRSCQATRWDMVFPGHLASLRSSHYLVFVHRNQ